MTLRFCAPLHAVSATWPVYASVPRHAYLYHEWTCPLICSWFLHLEAQCHHRTGSSKTTSIDIASSYLPAQFTHRTAVFCVRSATETRGRVRLSLSVFDQPSISILIVMTCDPSKQPDMIGRSMDTLKTGRAHHMYVNLYFGDGDADDL